MRYLNLFNKITHVRTNNCFFYSNYIVYAVPRVFVSKAIGPNGKNVKKIALLLKRKIKIIPLPNGLEDAEKFVSDIVRPTEFKNLEISPDSVTITANKQSKAELIGRNKTRFLELEKIIKEFFNKQLRIV